VPEHLRDIYDAESNDLTPEVLQNLDFLEVDYLIPIGGDDTLSYAERLQKEGVRSVAIPKTMDNDVPGTDYCIGFSTCVTRTIEMTHGLRTTAGSHERILVIEVFGRYAGFTALLPTMAGAADRCVIPEHPFDIAHLAELLVEDRRSNPSTYSVVLVSEGARASEDVEMVFEDDEPDQYGHRKLGGVSDRIASVLKQLSPEFNEGRPISVVSQRLGYFVRSGVPDAIDSVVPMAFGNLALDLLLSGKSGRLVSLRNGRYDDVPLDVVTGRKKVVDVARYYDPEHLRPRYDAVGGLPMFVMTSDL
jgi:6-phosphofructokinase 1